MKITKYRIQDFRDNRCDLVPGRGGDPRGVPGGSGGQGDYGRGSRVGV